ncbi:MAG: hypothetical protein Ct9H90mP1_2650 [Methanobacteriota archaeon]|nr:MAG: hypothetical protein Ct9H90mP1_2650 [Euryarchaeota archaeon]
MGKRSAAIAAADEEANLSIELDEEGVCIKSDTVGGLEALAKELREVGVPIREASIGKVSRRDVRSAEASSDPLHRIIMAFSTEILEEAEEEISSSEAGVKHIGSDIIYRILEEREEWGRQGRKSLKRRAEKSWFTPDGSCSYQTTLSESLNRLL